MSKVISFEHCLSMEAVSLKDCEHIFKQASLLMRSDRKVSQSLQGARAALLFFEPSVRTLMSFSLALSQLSIDYCAPSMAVVGSSVKAERLEDKIYYLASLGFNMLIVRHHVLRWWEPVLSSLPKGLSFSLINAGDSDGGGANFGEAAVASAGIPVRVFK